MSDLQPVETVETPVEPVQQPLEPPQTSLVEHQEQFGPEPQRIDAEESARARDEATGRFTKERHRARSQKAAAEDVETINTLTRELREAQEELGKVRPEALKDSPRVAALRRQIRGIKAELDEVKAPTPQRAAPESAPRQEPQAPQPQAFQPQAFTETEPTLDQFQNQPDPYADWMLARWEYRQRKAHHEYQQQYLQHQQQQMAQQAQAQMQAEHQQLMQGYAAKLQEFTKAHPDYGQKLQAAIAQDDQLPGPLYHALIRDDNGPALTYHLLNNPDLMDEMRLLASSLPPTEGSVALLRRRLASLSRSQAGTTGSALATPAVIAPRPPNPVRTGPLKTGDEPPADGSLIAHARAYGPKTIRRR